MLKRLISWPNYGTLLHRHADGSVVLRTWWGAWRNFRIPADHVANVEADLRFASGLNWWVTTLLFICVLTWDTEALLYLLAISLVSTVVQVWYPLRRVGHYPTIDVDRASLRPYN